MTDRRLLTATTLIANGFLVAAQSACNPMQGKCPSIPGLKQAFSTDFTGSTAVSSDWIIADQTDRYLHFSPTGLEFRLENENAASNIWTSKYFHYGKAEVTLRAAPGIGVISSAVLMSDTKDEVDWEWSGNDFAKGKPTVQTNYFGKGITGNYDRGTMPTVDKSMTQNFMTYTLDWKPDSLTWAIDGKVVRTLLKSSTDKGTHQYPQTPSRFHLGVWDAGARSVGQGTVQWAGGYTDLNGFPYSMYVKSVKITPYSSCNSYSYKDTSGSSASVACLDTEADTPKQSSGSLDSRGGSGSTIPTVSVVHDCSKPLPTNLQPNTPETCAAYYTHNTSGDGCATIAKKLGSKLQDLKDWNPQVGPDCYNLWLGYAMCASPPGECNRRMDEVSSTDTNVPVGATPMPTEDPSYEPDHTDEPADGVDRGEDENQSDDDGEATTSGSNATSAPTSATQSCPTISSLPTSNATLVCPQDNGSEYMCGGSAVSVSCRYTQNSTQPTSTVTVSVSASAACASQTNATVTITATAPSVCPTIHTTKTVSASTSSFTTQLPTTKPTTSSTSQQPSTYKQSSTSTTSTTTSTPKTSLTPEPYVKPTTTTPSTKALTPTTLPTASCYTYLSCYAEVPGRGLRGKSFTAFNLTNQVCADYCKGYKYFGTQVGTECYCANDFSGGCKKATDGRCKMACAADRGQICGGRDGLSVYQLDSKCAGAGSSPQGYGGRGGGGWFGGGWW